MTPAAHAAAFERLADTATLETPARTRRMLVIVNPYATTMSVRLKQLVVYALQGRFEVEAVDTQRKGHAIELCREAADEGYDVVVAFGGDGTVNEAANGLAGSDTVLTCLPGGATNVYCRMLGIPTDVVDATEHLLGLADAWAPRAVDLARVNDRWFTFSAGAGLDATRRRARRQPSAPEGALRPVVLRPGRGRDVPGEATSSTRRASSPPPAAARARASACSCRTRSPTPTSAAARSAWPTAPHLQSGDLSGAVLTRANAIDVPTIAYRLLAQRARVDGHRRVDVVRRARRAARALGRRAAGARPGRRRLHRHARGGRLQRPPRRPARPLLGPSGESDGLLS